MLPGVHRGQFIRSVDFDGPAHIWGLRAGDRVLAVNGFVCEDQDHETVISFILQTPGRSNLELVVSPQHKANGWPRRLLCREPHHPFSRPSSPLPAPPFPALSPQAPRHDVAC